MGIRILVFPDKCGFYNNNFTVGNNIMYKYNFIRIYHLYNLSKY